MYAKLMKRFAIIFTLSSAAITAAATAQTEGSNANQDYDLMLVGGALKTCSSMSSQYCYDTDWIDRDNMRLDRYLNLGGRYQARATEDALWPALRRDTRDDVREALALIRERLGEDVIPERVFIEEFTRRATRYLYDNMSDAEWNRVLDHLEMPVPETRTEVADVEQNVNKSSTLIMKRFVEMARNAARAKGAEADAKPKVLVMTASARDPLDAVDFYVSAFNSAGANTTWLPIDAAVMAARRNDDCDNLDSYRPKHLGSWDRARVHPRKHAEQVKHCKNPELALELVANADAVFLNGGDQNLMRNALLTPDNMANDLLNAIYAKLRDDELVVGGTSAGTAVMTARPMISNGTSAAALIDGAKAAEPPKPGCDRDNSCSPNLEPDSLTYHPLGGISLFPYAILDTHFSERGRHGRLLRLAATTGTPMAIGVDETTALMVDLDSGNFNVLGERGVFFALGAQQGPNAVASTFHYFVDGTSGVLNEREVTNVEFSTQLDLIKVEPTSNFMSDRGAVDAMRLFCQERKQIRLAQDEFVMVMQIDDETRTQKAGAECQIYNGRMGISYEPQQQL